MAMKSTVYKATLQLSDMDRNVYGEHSLTLALHPSETEERLMVRLLAFALNVPADDHGGALVAARGLSDTDEPDLWHLDLTGRLMHWIEMGQPDDRRMSKACGRADRVSIYTYSVSSAVWFAGIKNKITRLRNLSIWQIDAEASQAMAALARRAMQLQVTVQDGQIWLSSEHGMVELQPQALWAPEA